MDLKLDGKRAIITGSSQGIGKAIAKSLLEEGCQICINGLDENKLEKTSNELQNALYVKADVTKIEECEKITKTVVKELGGVDVLICNVGSGRTVLTGEESVSDWLRMMELNFFSSVNIINSCLDELKKSRGVIVCISSIAGIDKTSAPITYSVAKAALNNYIKNISTYFSNFDIRINGVAPGNIFFKGSVWEEKSIVNPELVKKTLESVPQKRFGTPEEISNLVCYLSSPLSNFITGKIITADGGQING